MYIDNISICVHQVELFVANEISLELLKTFCGVYFCFGMTNALLCIQFGLQ